MRIALVADTHLSARSPECVANWRAAGRAIGRMYADFTVHLGDITLDAQNHPEELAFAAGLLDRWPTPLRCVPGNHDMGDASGEAPLAPALLTAYQAHFGSDRWAVRADDWLMLGINAQLLGSDSEQEAEQWRWIEAQAADAGRSAHTALFLHRPMLRPGPGEARRTGRYVAHAASARLLGGPLQSTLRLVVSGHTHQYLDTTVAGVRHLWMPSTGFVLADDMQTRVGEKLVGVGLLELGAEGSSFDLWCPDGMQRHELSAMRVFDELAKQKPARMN